MLKKTFIIFVGIILGMSGTLGIVWEPDTQITFLNKNIGASIDGAGDTLYIFIGYKEKLFYKKSIDGGETWGADIDLLGNRSGLGITINGENIHIVWGKSIPVQEDMILYFKSEDGGENWSEIDTLANVPFPKNVFWPLITAFEENVYVMVCHRDSGGSYSTWEFMRSKDTGVSWGISDTICIDRTVQVGGLEAVDSSIYWVRTYFSPCIEVFCLSSSDYGVTWKDTMLSPDDSIASQSPAISCDGEGGIHICWWDFIRSGGWVGDVLYRRSIDNGATWDTIQCLTSVPIADSDYDIFALGENVYIIWRDTRDSTYGLYFKMSTDRGETWSEEEELVSLPNNNSGNFPYIYVSKNNVYIVWEEWKAYGVQEIYFKKGKLTGVEERDCFANARNDRLQIKPNPFFQATSISYELSVTSEVSLKIYDISGREVKNLLDSFQEKGSYKIFWNGRNNQGKEVKNGIYFCIMESDKKEKMVKKILLMK